MKPLIIIAIAFVCSLSLVLPNAYAADIDFQYQFKEMVKIAITPMISSLSILNYVDMDSEVEVLGYGISLILLNIGMYFIASVIVILRIRKLKC